MVIDGTTLAPMHPSVPITAGAFPWHALSDPIAQWARLPTFLLGEYAIVLATLIALVHAVRRGHAHVLVWIAALVAGTANDLIFMALPLVDNFWHAQATLMITPRLPVYIPCLYVLFMYYPVVAVARLGKTRTVTAALAGLVAVLTYAPFDIVGAKFLWWTWHDTDAPIRARLLGVPVSSTLWVLTFAGAFAWLAAPSLLAPAPPSRRSAAIALLRVAALTTPLMMLQMVPLQMLDGGVPGYVSLGSGLALYALVAIRARRERSQTAPMERLPLVGLVLHLVTLSVCITGFDPATHVSTGVHETIGPCDAASTDLSGSTRRSFLCLDDFDEDYAFTCAERPAPGARWYTICGRPFRNAPLYRGVVIALATMGVLVYATLFGVLRAEGKAERRAAT